MLWLRKSGFCDANRAGVDFETRIDVINGRDQRPFYFFLLVAKISPNIGYRAVTAVRVVVVDHPPSDRYGNSWWWGFIRLSSVFIFVFLRSKADYFGVDSPNESFWMTTIVHQSSPGPAEAHGRKEASFRTAKGHRTTIIIRRSLSLHENWKIDQESWRKSRKAVTEEF